MILYSRFPNLKLREEEWGGVVRLPSGKVVCISEPELFKRLQNFVTIELDGDEMPKYMAQLLNWGLIIKETKST